jgi:alkylation response protein AidB-like acyl-CoA dehydrogenase
MDFSLSKEQETLVAAVAGISSRFGDDYWLKRDHDGGLPQEFVAALAQNGWLGICIPEEYRGRPRHPRCGIDDAHHRPIRRGHERRAAECTISKNEKEQGRNMSWRIGSKSFC